MNPADSTHSAPPASEGPQLPQPRLLAIGNFDGVHRGHQQLLAQVVAQAEEAGLRPAVMTFSPHPSQVLGLGKKATLTSLPLKLELLQAVSDRLEVLVEPFTIELSKLSPRSFAHRLIEKYHARQVLVGENFRFGKGRQGDLQTLRALGQELGFAAAAAELLTCDDEPISSSRIRAAISSGDLAQAQALLGRPHRLRGLVVPGDRRGRQLGYPTANLDGVEEMPPPNGVYGGYVRVQDRLYRAIANIGVRPTVVSHAELDSSIEIHLLEFQGDLYGQTLVFELQVYLRPERRFESLAALQEQIERDAEAAALLLPPPQELRGKSSV